MADNKPEIFNFHKVREQCEQANAEGWRAFLVLYGPLCMHLLAMYAPEGVAADTVWDKTLRILTDNNFERFRATARQNEREFLADLRALLLGTITEMAAPGSASEAVEQAASNATPAAETAHADPAIAPILNSEKLTALLEGLPLLHQEMLFFKLAGYTDATIELMERVAPRVAAKAFERLSPNFDAALYAKQDRCLWPREWLAILQQARGAKKETCPELHQILRVHDGQVSWYDKEPVEKHTTGCLYCLERWTSLREVNYWRRVAPPASPEQIEAWLRALPVRPEEKKSFFRRVLG